MLHEDRKRILVNFVTLEHSGQKRKNGEDYLSHLLAVARPFQDCKDLVLFAIGLLHDCKEDQNTSDDKIIRCLESAKFSSDEIKDILTAVDLLTKSDDFRSEDIIQYTLDIRENVHAREVKISDISHNLLDLDDGNLKQKYLLQLFILTN